MLITCDGKKGENLSITRHVCAYVLAKENKAPLKNNLFVLAQLKNDVNVGKR